MRPSEPRVLGPLDLGVNKMNGSNPLEPHLISNLGILLLIVSNGLWYRVKFYLRSRGYEANWFTHHFRDFVMIRQLEKAETAPEEKSKAKRMKRMLYATPILFVIAALLFFGGNVI
jgi:hypothetical protein